MRLNSVICLIGIAWPAPVLAQAAETVQDTITVTGRQLRGEEVRAISNAFVRKLSAVPKSGQYARWKEPVCPKTLGVGEKADAVVIGKIREVAGQVGAPLGKKGCRANLIVTFTDDAPGLMRQVLKRRPRDFAGIAPDERALLLGPAMPVRWWYATGFETPDGRRSTALSPAISSSANPLDVPQNGEAGYLDTYNSTLIGTKVRVNLTSAAVVVDVGLAKGKSLDSIAAYAAMVGLSRIKADDSPADVPTIMRLFASDPETPDDLTPWDMAYLTALYRIPVDRPASVQQAMMIGEMTKALRSR